LPEPDNLVGLLTQDASVAYLTGEAKKNRKNIEKVITRSKELSEAENIPDDMKDKAAIIIQNAKRLTKQLEEIRREQNISDQSSLDSIFEDALYELRRDNKEPMVKFLTTVEGGTNRQKKKDILLKNKNKLIQSVDENDIDLLYYDTSERNYTTTQPNVQDNLKALLSKHGLDKLGAEIKQENDNTILVLPEKINANKYNEFKDSIYTLEQRRDNPIRFERSGKVIPSPLVKLFGDSEQSARLDTKVTSAETKNYQVNVNNSQDVLKYLKLLSGKGWRKKLDFMPTPVMKNKKAVANARKLLLMPTGKSPTVSRSLESLLTTSSLNLEQLLESGAKARTSKFIPNQVLALLEKSHDKQSKFYTDDDYKGRYAKKPTEVAGVSIEEIEELRELFLKSNEEMPRFVRLLKNRPESVKRNFDKLINYYKGAASTLFSEEEKEFLEGLRGEDEFDTSEKLQEFYKTEEDTFDMADALQDMLRENKEIFVEVDGRYKLKPLDISVKIQREFVQSAKALRANTTGQEINIGQAESMEELLKEYKTGYKPETNDLDAASLLYTLRIIDTYYGDKSLMELNNDYYDEPTEENLKELIKLADTNYTDIMNGLLESVKNKVNHMLENKQQYIELVTFGDNQVYEVFGRLKQENLITESLGED
jgi:hypothetical protein